MSVQDRAAQFSPFAALTGFDDAVRETARFTDTKRELADDEIEKINEVLNRLSDMINENPQIELTYFKKDEKKDGGAYVRKVGYVKRLDEYEKPYRTCGNRSCHKTGAFGSVQRWLPLFLILRSLPVNL